MAIARVNENTAAPNYKWLALGVVIFGLIYCLLLGGLAAWSRAEAFQLDANFALFSAFIVVAGAIERFMEPLSAVLPPAGDSAVDKSNRALLTLAIALLVGITISSIFGLYFMEAIGVDLGELSSDGEKLVRGADIFITALIITGGSKNLHDLLKTIEKTKENAAAES